MSDKHKSKILPCPFCGCEAVIERGEFTLFVVCTNQNCFCAMGERYDGSAMSDHHFHDADVAMAAWNTRAKISASAEQIAYQLLLKEGALQINKDISKKTANSLIALGWAEWSGATRIIPVGKP